MLCSCFQNLSFYWNFAEVDLPDCSNCIIYSWMWKLWIVFRVYDWTGNRRLKCICQSGWQARPITGHYLPGYMSKLCDDSHKIDLFEAAHSNRNFILVTDCIMPLVFVYNILENYSYQCIGFHFLMFLSLYLSMIFFSSF